MTFHWLTTLSLACDAFINMLSRLSYFDLHDVLAYDALAYDALACSILFICASIGKFHGDLQIVTLILLSLEILAIPRLGFISKKQHHGSWHE